MERDVLERKFDEDLIKNRRFADGTVLSYVEGAYYIERLNEAFDGAWSFDVVDYSILEHDIIVVGKLTAGDITKVAFGGRTIRRHRETKEPLGLADDLKAASTDALKKASSLFGLGLHLYTDRSTRPVEVGVQRRTDRQLNAINAIAKSAGWAQETLHKYSVSAYGAPPEELSKADASSLIDELKKLPTSLHVAA